ncbi:MAG: hypothetical protein PF690_17435 [Deltaproteobacteria bacterium]|jgi:hypothetical protein|nr:hypothetical protein [Deltaproteobacteria bacterium]
MTQPKFNIGDHVFHVLPESPPGVVVEVIYRLSYGRYSYCVMFDPMTAALEYEEFELSDSKTFQ